jgi:hypothetical protein
METPKQRSASKAKPNDMNPDQSRDKSVPKKETSKPDIDKSAPNPALPRYDDQPKKSGKGDNQTSGGDLPDYGDQEPGDPRQIDIHD